MIEYHPNLLTKDEVDFLVAAPKTQNKEYGIGITGKRDIFFIANDLLPNSITNNSNIIHAMVNMYSVPYTLPYHPDNMGFHGLTNVVVVCLETEYGESLQFKKFDHPDNPDHCDLDSYDFSFPLNPGDAVSWTAQDEIEGWLHGGKFNGKRMSMVVRYAA